MTACAVQMSYQLHSSRHFGPINDTLKMLSEAGFKSVEGYDGIYSDVPVLRGLLSTAGLKMTSCQIALGELQRNPFKALAITRTLSAKKVFVPPPVPNQGPADDAGWRQLAQDVYKAGRPFADAGIVFGWHNHDFELQVTRQGSLPLDLIADAGLPLSLDLGWIARAGLDPVAMINRFGERISTVRMTDVAPLGDHLDEDGWADLGQGTLDWTSIHRALQSACCDHYVIQHNQVSNDARFAKNSLAFLRDLTGQS